MSSTTPVKILGREPAFYVGVVEAVVALLLTFNLPGLSVEQAGLVVAFVVALGGVVSAWATRDTLLAALVGAVKAVLLLGVAYGLPLTDEQVGLAAVLVSVLGSGWLRTQTSPAETLVSAGTEVHYLRATGGFRLDTTREQTSGPQPSATCAPRWLG